MLKIPEYYSEGIFTPFAAKLTAGRTPQTFQANDQLVTIGEFMSRSFYIHRGVLRFYILDAETGREKTEWFIGPGDLFPLYSPLERQYRMERDAFLVKAQTDVVVTPLSQQFLASQLADTDFANSMLRQYADFSNILLYDAVILASQDSQTKVCNYLYQYEKLLKPHGIVLTQEAMASNVGVPLLTFTRVLQKLREKGIVTTARKSLTIVDWPGLVRLCSPELLAEN